MSDIVKQNPDSIIVKLDSNIVKISQDQNPIVVQQVGDILQVGTLILQASWGQITGTLSNQTDLWNALQARNPAGSAGDVQINRGDGTFDGDDGFKYAGGFVTITDNGLVVTGDGATVDIHTQDDNDGITITSIGDGNGIISDMQGGGGLSGWFKGGSVLVGGTSQTQASSMFTIYGQNPGMNIRDTGNDANFTIINSGAEVDLIIHDTNVNTIFAGININLSGESEYFQSSPGAPSSLFHRFYINNVLKFEVGNLAIKVPDGINVVLGTTTGTQFGTSSTQKLSFYAATPIVRPSGNILTALSNLGLISSPTFTWGSITGTLSSQTDLQAALNAKQNTLTIGNLTEATSSVLTITGGTGAIIGSGLSIQVKQASTSISGYLSSTDWNTFNNKQPSGSYLTAVSIATANGFAGSSSGGTTPALTITTSITGLLKGNGTAISAATAGTDYLTPATGVVSIAKTGSAALHGAVTLTGGTNVTLTQSGNDISIAATGGGGTPGGSLNDIQIHGSGSSFYGDNNYTYDPNSGTVTLSSTTSDTSFILNNNDNDDFYTYLKFQINSSDRWVLAMPAFNNGRLTLFNSGSVNTLIAFDPSEDSVNISSPTTGNHIVLYSGATNTRSYFGQQPSGTALLSVNVDGTDNINDTTYSSWRTYLDPELDDASSRWGIEYSPANAGVYSPQHMFTITGDGNASFGTDVPVNVHISGNLTVGEGNVTPHTITLFDSPQGHATITFDDSDLNTGLTLDTIGTGNSGDITLWTGNNGNIILTGDSQINFYGNTAGKSFNFGDISEIGNFTEFHLDDSSGFIHLTAPMGGITLDSGNADTVLTTNLGAISLSTGASSSGITLSAATNININSSGNTYISPGTDFIVNASAGLAQFSAGGSLNIDGQGTAAMTITGITEWAFSTTDITNVSGFGNVGDVFTCLGIGSGTSWSSPASVVTAGGGLTSIPWASPGTLGSTTPNTIAGTTLSLTGKLIKYNNINTSGYGIGVHRYQTGQGAQTVGQTIGSYTPGATGTFVVSGFLNITAISTDVIKLTITFKDTHGTTQTLTPLSGLSVVGFNTFYVGEIQANATAITVATVLTTSIGSITYDIGLTITQVS